MSKKNRRPFTQRKRSERILIVVEGSECEPRYFRALRLQWRLSSIHVVPCAKGTDPRSIVRYAKDELAKAHMEKAPFKDVWVVFDHERHGDNPLLLQAMDMARGNSIKVALSNPSFEYWLILHFIHTTALMLNASAAIAILKQFIPNYEKADYNTELVMPHIGIAIDHGARVRNHWRHHDIPRHGYPNPMTDVDLLAQHLRDQRRDQ